MGDQPFEPEVVGVAGVLRKLHGMQYPLGKRDILDRVGDARIRWVKAEPPVRVHVKELIQALPNRSFRDEADLAAELRQVAQRQGLPV